MDGQLFFTWFAIGLAGAYILVRIGQAWRGGKSCGGGCGCPTARAVPGQSLLIAPEQVKMRNR